MADVDFLSLTIPDHMRSTTFPDQNVSVPSLLLLRLPSQTVADPPPLHEYFSKDDPHHESPYPYHLCTHTIPTPGVVPTPTGSYLAVDPTNGEEEILDEEHAWIDGAVTSIEAQDSAFEIEAEVDIRALIVTQVLSDEFEQVSEQEGENVNGDAPSSLEDTDAGWDDW